MTSPGNLKKELRQLALARREGLEPAFRIDASLDIAQFTRLLTIEPGEPVSGFWPIRSEVDVRPAMAALRDRGARLCLPVVVDRATIVFREMTRDAPMVETGFGTLGPDGDAAELMPSLMLVPLAAFDARGHRIGYGAGLYDRAIARQHAAGLRPRLIGIAFDCQQVPNVPNEPHDVVLDAVLTESGLRRFGASA